MDVFMVTVAGEGELAVVAQTPHEAVRLAAEELVKASNLRARRADPAVAQRLLGARKRERMKISGRSARHPLRPGDTRREERRLREHIKCQERIAAYVEDLHAKSPPLTPAQARSLSEAWLRLWAAKGPPPRIIAAARHLADHGKR